jgi:hypothetical protein
MEDGVKAKGERRKAKGERLKAKGSFSHITFYLSTPVRLPGEP